MTGYGREQIEGDLIRGYVDSPGPKSFGDLGALVPRASPQDFGRVIDDWNSKNILRGVRRAEKTLYDLDPVNARKHGKM